MAMKISRQWFAGGIALLLLGMTPTVDYAGQDAPDLILLDSLSELYDGVSFDHAMHVDLAEGCSTCHHHTTGTGAVDERCGRCHTESREETVVACRDCHARDPFSAAALRDQNQAAYHIDKPGLKGAYHLNCLGCHEQLGAPVGCGDCHTRTTAGDAFFHAGIQVPADMTGGKHGH